MSRLQTILDHTRTLIPGLAARREIFERGVASLPPAPDFAGALRGANVALIAEVKRRSPSAGNINEALDPVGLAREYSSGGAAAVSVLTDQHFFGGSIDDLAAVAAAIEKPVLRKDFILDEVQLLEARARGAAAALLIVRALEQRSLAALLSRAGQIGLAALVEVHDDDELTRALDAGATVIGINARNLDDFTIDTAAAWRLVARVPSTCVAVAESGMASLADVEGAAAAGADAVLVGTALARAGDPERMAREFSGVRRRGR